jgi:2-polyprenyl-6-methoxyphenol hydroxylase-like FAD-dependent oxidoreductase
MTRITPEGIVTVGDGIAGPAMARNLAEQGIRSTLIVEGEIPGADTALNFRRRPQVPVTQRSSMEELGVDTSGMPRIEYFNFALGSLRFGPVAKRFSSWQGLADTVAPDTVAARNQLVSYADASPHVEIVEGKVDGVDVGDGPRPQVRGVYVDGQHVPASLVIDATGSAAFVADEVNEAVPGSIKVTKRKVPTTYLGAYVQLGDVSGTRHFQDADSVGMVGVLPTGNRALLAPHKLEGSPASHLLILSGSEAAIDASNDAVPAGASKQEAFVARAEALCGEGSMWGEVIERIEDADRFNSYKFPTAQSRIPQVGGLVLIGDASLHTNPAAGQGLKHIRHDVHDLGTELAATNYAERAGDRFNATRPKVLGRRLTETTWASRTFSGLGAVTKGVMKVRGR